MDIITVDDFDLQQTLECGQCFRWIREPDASYTGVVGRFVANVTQVENKLIINSKAPTKFWSEYFDLERDYGEIKKQLSKDSVMREAIKAGGGIRLLKQPFWECLASFIISQCNNIPRIMKIIESLCRNFGEEIEHGYYSFPEPDAIFAKDLSVIKCGYRDKYLQDAARRMLAGEDLSTKQKLLEVNGVGEKVANCVLLFGAQKYDVFPADVWIKRIVSELYSIKEKNISEFARKNFAQYSGFAQQYLFFYARDSRIFCNDIEVI